MKSAFIGFRKPVYYFVAAVLFTVVLGGDGQAQESKRPLSKSQVIELLENSVPSARIADLASQYGIAFELTSQAENELREAGATDELLKSLREIAAKATAATPPAPEPVTAPSPVPPVLLIETSPPGAEVYIDEERAGKTSPEGKLKVSNLPPGQYRLRASLEGHQDYSRDVDLSAGQTTVVAVALVAEKPSPAETPAPTSAPAQATGPAQPAVDIRAILGAMTGESDAGKDGPNLKRFSVTHQHGGRVLGYGGGGCYGWLIIGEGRIQFSSDSEAHAFDVGANEVADVQLKSNHLRLRIKDKKYHLVTQDMGMFGGASQGPGAMRRALESVGIKPED
ncbi:MAG: PEGA domain-containing protein [Acidobacteria bacterium]|nr:PEGA domain-containing protein [Acidobacteriota bacterium]